MSHPLSYACGGERTTTPEPDIPHHIHVIRKFVRTERTAAVDLIVIDRSPVNAIDVNAMSEISDTVHERLADASTAAVVLTGTGEFFSAGLDLKLVPTYDAATWDALVQCLTRLIYDLYGARIPVIAAVNGHAVAAGTLLTLACDYRIGPSEPYRFGLTGARVDIPYPPAALAVFEAELSAPVRRQMLLGARTYDSETARRFGILDELCPQGQVMARAIEIARDLSEMPKQNYATLKRQLREQTLASIRDAEQSHRAPPT